MHASRLEEPFEFVAQGNKLTKPTEEDNNTIWYKKTKQKINKKAKLELPKNPEQQQPTFNLNQMGHH